MTAVSRTNYTNKQRGREFIIVWRASSEISILARLDFGKRDNNSRRCLPQEHVLCALTPRRFHAPSCVKFDNLTPAGRLESIRRKWGHPKLTSGQGKGRSQREVCGDENRASEREDARGSRGCKTKTRWGKIRKRLYRKLWLGCRNENRQSQRRQVYVCEYINIYIYRQPLLRK